MQRQARVWKRILAFLVDLYIGVMVFSAFFIIIVQEVPHSLGEALRSALSPAAAAAVIFASIFMLLYHVFCEYIVGQTPGMMLLRVSVENNQPKKELSFWQALVRNLFVLPVFPFTLFWIIEPLYYVFQGQRLLEYWSRTDTVE